MKKIIFLCFLIILFCPNAFAHKVNIFAYVEGDTVYTESYFPDGKKVAGGLIEVYDTEGKKLLEGKTDNVGQFNFKVPLALLGTAPFGDGPKGRQKAREKPAKSLPKKGDLKIILNASLGHRATYTVSADEMVDIPKKIQPEGVSLRDIIAGIGYILGITGIFMFFLSKKINASTRNR